MSSLKSKACPGRLQGVHRLAQSICFSRRLSLPQFGTFALLGLMVSCGNKTETPAPAPQTNATSSPAAASPELAKLVGKWERPDGGYILEIRGVDPSGKLDVGYFNPNPINVSRAVAWREKGASKLVIELRDVNYPGCIYTLEHNPQTDQLFGQYYQAAVQETYEIVFARMK
jgi:hypothetical protein